MIPNFAHLQPQPPAGAVSYGRGCGKVETAAYLPSHQFILVCVLVSDTEMSQPFRAARSRSGHRDRRVHDGAAADRSLSSRMTLGTEQ